MNTQNLAMLVYDLKREKIRINPNVDLHYLSSVKRCKVWLGNGVWVVQVRPDSDRPIEIINWIIAKVTDQQIRNNCPVPFVNKHVSISDKMFKERTVK